MARILSVSERIKLFKEINRVHREIYDWKILYKPLYGFVEYIDIDRNLMLQSPKEWIPLDESEAGKYYFHDNKGRDITSLRGIFAWEAYHFPHLYLYKYYQYDKPVEEDYVSDSLGKRIRPDVGHPVKCLETTFDVRQRKNDGKIWISSNWIYHTDLYETVSEFGDDIYETLSEAAGGDDKISEGL